MAEDKFTSFLKKVRDVVAKIVEFQKEKNEKEVIKWHEKLDALVHGFVGEQGKTPKEKEHKI